MKKSIKTIVFALFVAAGSMATAKSLCQSNAAYERQDWSAAFTGFKFAAERGDAEAQYCLGTMYANAMAVPRSYGQAAFWYKKAANQGNEAAQSILGQMYDQGQGVAQNYELAIFWYRKAAEHAGRLATVNQLILGRYFRNVLTVAQDNIEAHKWLNIASINGDTNAIQERERIEVLMTPSQILEAQRRASDWVKLHH